LPHGFHGQTTAHTTYSRAILRVSRERKLHKEGKTKKEEKAKLRKTLALSVTHHSMEPEQNKVYQVFFGNTWGSDASQSNLHTLQCAFRKPITPVPEFCVDDDMN
jgi:hypothetical protein